MSELWVISLTLALHELRVILRTKIERWKTALGHSLMTTFAWLSRAYALANASSVTLVNAAPLTF